MSHRLKALPKIDHQRDYIKLEQNMSKTHFDSKGGIGTMKALFTVNVLSQHCLVMNQPMYVCVKDYNKAFDKMRQLKLVNILNKTNLDDKNVRIISRFYFNQKVVVKFENPQSTEIQIKRRVRKGYVRSPMLFKIYSEEIRNCMGNESR